MKTLTTIIILTTFFSCARGQQPQNGYVTYPEIRKAFSAKLPISYDAVNGIFSAPANLGAYTNDANFLTPVTAGALFATIKHTHAIGDVTGLNNQLAMKASTQNLADSVAALNAKILALSKRMDSIQTKSITYRDTTTMYVIVHTIPDSTYLPK